LAAPISDYGKIYTSRADYSVAQPASAADVCALVRTARARQQRIRVRGSGHTFSGATLPADGEVLLRTHALDRYRFAAPGTITVGAGALVWDVRDFVQRHGLVMPVYNGGWAGPSIGGFVSAGGMRGVRVSPEEHDTWMAADARGEAPIPLVCGFWEHVAAITLVDGAGTVREFTPADPVFPWLFGSYGQFGVVVDVTLRLMRDGSKAAYPAGEEGRIPRVQAEDPAVNDRPPAPEGDRCLYWFSYLMSSAQEQTAWTELEEWVRRHPDVIHPQGGWAGPVIGGEPIGYRYPISFRTFTPPLFYPHAEDIVLLGVMTMVDGVGTPRGDERILALEHEFVAAAHRHGFRLYPQAENIGRTLDYESYYGAETYSAFARLKHRFDPDGIVNPGVVFAAGVEPPPRSSADRLSVLALEHLLKGV
jgi:FAD/FMN-containing dehydrogenase